jgi:hypothetical protein
MPLLYSALHEHKQANNIRAGIEGAALLVELPSMSTRDGWARMVAAQHGEATTSTVHEVEGAMTIAVNWRGPLQACERSIDPDPATVKLGQIHFLLNRAASLHGWLAPSPLSSCPAGCHHPPHAVMHQSLTVSSHHHELGGDADCHQVLAKPSLLEMDAHRVPS